MTEQDLSLVRVLYLGLSVGVIVFFLQLEAAAPRVPFDNQRHRWWHVGRNLGLLLLVILFADLVVGEALLQAHRVLLHSPLTGLGAGSWPLGAQIVLGFLASDLVEYGFHWASHRVGWLWRLHAVHHMDPHLDVTSAGRAHPLEISLHVALKLALYALLGLPLWIEGVRAILHNSLLFVQHANYLYPPWLERLRWLLVTPAMHRLHHHRHAPHINRNYGFVFPWWDHLFGTYQTPDPVAASSMGLPGCDGEYWQTLSGMLMAPFRMVGGPER